MPKGKKSLMSKAKDAIADVYGDTSVSKAETKSRLEELVWEIEETYLPSLEEDDDVRDDDDDL